MKYLAGGLIGAIVALFMLAISPLYAQGMTPFWQWPVLWSAAENYVVKRGENGKIYSRIGWGSCLVTEVGEVREFIQDMPTDRFIKARDYAEQRLEQDSLSDEDRANCPQQPLQVKPTWRGSRPVYAMHWDALNHTGTRMEKTPYRAIDGACLRYNARTEGEVSNYWMLAMETTVYLDDAPVLVANVDTYLTAICEPEDVPIEDWRS